MIRQMVAADLAGIGAILSETDLFPPELLPEMAATALEGSPSEIWFVAHDADQITAFAFCRVEEMTDRTWNILALAVDPGHQSQGTGRAMLHHIADHFGKSGQRMLIVDTADSPEFAPQRRFYAQNGYDQVAHIPHFYQDDTGKITFCKRL